MNDVIWATDKKTSESITQKYQGKLNYWSDDFFEQCNPLARCGLFGISRNAPEYYQTLRDYNVIGEGEVRYKGWQLSVFDEDVFLLLLQYMRGQSLFRPLKFKKSQLLSDLGLTKTGTNYKKVTNSINRLYDGTLEISSKPALKKLLYMLTDHSINKKMDDNILMRLAENYSSFITDISNSLESNNPFFLDIRFISNKGESPTDKSMSLKLDPLMVLFFDGINTTRINRQERGLLTPAEKKLLSFTQSHSKGVYDLRIERYAEILGTDIDFSKTASVRRFRQSLTKWLSSLERLNRIRKGWSVEDGKVKGIFPITGDNIPEPQCAPEPTPLM